MKFTGGIDREMKEEPDLVMSPLCQAVERDGHMLRVEVYCSDKSDWTLEVVNEAGESIVWNETFDTDQMAFDEFLRTLDREGIESF